jgi:catechol 2,3-dioxygenase-like lactoylglutathione lyase family enzyme
MRVIRIVPNLKMNSSEASQDFYAGFLGLEVGMDMEWIVTFVSATNPTAQLSTLTLDAKAPVMPDVSVEVDDVEGLYAEALRRGLAIVHPLTDELWGVRRFFVEDPSGYVINCLMHKSA